MENLLKLLQRLEPILKVENDELKEAMGDELTESEKDDLVARVEIWETLINNHLKQFRQYYESLLNGYEHTIKKAEVELGTFLTWLNQNRVGTDDLQEDIEEQFGFDIADLTTLYLNQFDKDVVFNSLSDYTVKWIEDWSKDLADLMGVNTHDSLRDYLVKGIEEGKGIQEIAEEIKDLPQFSRTRARTTAITEVLTAHSASHHESYMQSDVVVGKRWKHSGGKGIDPRIHHVEYSGTVVPKDQPFVVGGYEAMFPRDPQLPPSERVNCHCVMGPVTDVSELP